MLSSLRNQAKHDRHQLQPNTPTQLCYHPADCKPFRNATLRVAHILLTLLEPPGFGDFRKKDSSFRLPYQRPSSSADWARELFSGSNGLASLVDCTRRKIFCLGGAVFCEWRHKWRTFRPPWPTLPGPGRQPLGGSISLEFLLETMLQSESFDTLDDLLGFRVQKLWCK